MTESSHTSSDFQASAGRLGEMLVKGGLVTAAQVHAAMAPQGHEHPNLARGLVDLGFITESVLTNFLVKNMKLPRLSLGDYKISQDILRMLPRDLCLRYRLMPIDTLGKNLTLAMVNPLDDAALAAVQQACPTFRLKPFLCSLSDFELVAGRLLRTDSTSDSRSEISLDSLGIAPVARKTEALTPRTEAQPPATAEPEDDPTATQLFQNITPAARVSTGPLRASLICLDGWEPDREIEIQGTELTLGRAAEADITIHSPLISRVHARLTRNAEYGHETIAITDLKSSNGTFVNDIPVTTTVLRHGDRILLANVLFKFVLLDEVEARFNKHLYALYRIHKSTGLLPTDGWLQELERALANAPGAPLTVCLVEIDHLAALVEAHGPVAGVIVLNDVAALLERYLARGDLPCDYGSGRILILFENKPIETAYPLMEELRRAVECHVFHYKDERFRTTLSIGLTTCPRGSSAAPQLERLESGLQYAVRLGRNACAVQH